MRENQLPMLCKSAEETGRVRPAVDSVECGVHISRERVTHVEARPAGNYLADELSKSVHITMANFSAAGSASVASAVAVAPQALPGPRNQYAACDPEPYTKLKKARDSKLGTWLLVSAIVSLTTLYTNHAWVPSFVAQTVKISKQLSADIKETASTTLGGTAVTDTTKYGSGTVAGIHGAPTGRDSASAVQPQSETVIHTVRSNAGDSVHGGGMLPALSPQSKPLMIPPPPPTPCVLPPAFGFFPMQPAQQDTAPQQQLQPAQTQASLKLHHQAAALENTPQQPTAASGRTEASQSAALDVADQELQAALNSSLRTVGEWTR